MSDCADLGLARGYVAGQGMVFFWDNSGNPRFFLVVRDTKGEGCQIISFL